MKKITLFIIIVTSFTLGCKKDKPPVDIYNADFSGFYGNDNPVVFHEVFRIDITNSTKDEIEFDNSWLLKKDGHKLKSTNDFVFYPDSSPYNYIIKVIITNFEGKWKHKINGDYIINGKFQGTYQTYDQNNVLYYESPLEEGRLEITSKD